MTYVRFSTYVKLMANNKYDDFDKSRILRLFHGLTKNV